MFSSSSSKPNLGIRNFVFKNQKKPTNHPLLFDKKKSLKTLSQATPSQKSLKCKRKMLFIENKRLDIFLVSVVRETCKRAASSQQEEQTNGVLYNESHRQANFLLNKGQPASKCMLAAFT